VIGETCTDEFVYGKSVRLAPEAPAPVFVPEYTVTNKGMAANVVENLKSLGTKVEFITNSNTITKKRFVDDKTNHLFLRVDTGDQDTKPIEKIPKEYLLKFDIVVVSDYCKGLISENDIEYICESHPCVFIDTKKVLGSYIQKAKFIKINKGEYTASEKHIASVPGLIYKIIVTMGDQGCKLGDIIYPVPKVEVKDYAGAGDTFLAGLVHKYLQVHDIHTSIVFANECATKIVSKRGVSII